MHSILIATHTELQKVLFLTPSVCGFLFVYEIPQEQLNGFAPNSHGRLLDEFEDQDQRSRSPGTKTAFFGPFGSLHAVDVW